MSVTMEDTEGIRLAIEGCGHGTLQTIYASVEEACKQKHWSGVDLLIIGGDFQAVRNAYDLNCVSMPAKYRSMCDFHEYYSGTRTAPYLTVFVGGNHEASNYLFELYYGGWVAPNIYYMGAANVLRLGSIRIAALSGIWKGYNYRKPHFERLPYNESDLKSIYHVRELDVRKLKQIRTQVDVGISHDWPKGVEWDGNFKQLFRFKKHLEDDARSGQLGSVAAKEALDWLRPRWWFSAHLHCKFAAIVRHGQPSDQKQRSAPMQIALSTKNDDEIDLEIDVDPGNLEAPTQNADETNLGLDTDLPPPKNADEIDLELEDDQDGLAAVATGQGLDGVKLPDPHGAHHNGPVLSMEEARAVLPDAFRRPAAPETAQYPSGITNDTTQFLALDKCLPGRHFLQLLSVTGNDDTKVVRPLKLEYDREWLAITRTFAINEPLSLGDPEAHVPKTKSPAEYERLVSDARAWVEQNLSVVDLLIPENFTDTAPVYDGGDWNDPKYSQVVEYPSPQTAQFCELLQIPNALQIDVEELQRRLAAGPRYDSNSESFRGNGRGRSRGGSSRGRGGRGMSRGGPRGHFRGR